ncbi:MAG: DNA polymerase [Thermoleophilia bacterium]|nr:DNA polymerase [Thermoleophilia bacterium]
MPRELRRGRRHVRLSSDDRVLFPGAGVTKGDLWDYYAAVAPAVLPHLRDRPFTMKRFRGGIDRPSFFQKDAPKGAPSWLRTRAFRTQPRPGESRIVDFPLVDDEVSLLWMVQYHCIDLNVWYSRVDRPDRPDYVVFDLDPPDGGFRLAVRAAHFVRELLDAVGLPGYVKTSGADGIHVLAPIARRASYNAAREFAVDAAALLEREHPGLVTTEFLKRKRRGVYLDARQNGPGKTIASVYSVRPKPGAPVSTPLRWDELTEEVEPRDFGMADALARIEREGDLFAPVLAGGRSLSAARRALARLR